MDMKLHASRIAKVMPAVGTSYSLTVKAGETDWLVGRRADRTRCYRATVSEATDSTVTLLGVVGDDPCAVELTADEFNERILPQIRAQYGPAPEAR